MRKRWLTMIASLVLALAPVAQSLASTVEFGDNPSRTHYNGISDPQVWNQAANLKSFTFNGQTPPMGGGNGTAMGAGSTLYFPVSAPGDSATGVGYLTAWSLGSGPPKQAWANYIMGVSNSSPLILSNGDIYLAAAGTLYGFQPGGTPVAGVVSKNIFAANYIYQNQVVSYPLYANGLIWVSSQNGYLYAINPTTLQKVYKVPIGSRMDGSPTLVYGANNTQYIAVGTALAPKNQGGTGVAGQLFLVSMGGQIVSHINNPSGTGAAIASAPIYTGGGVAWNDISGNVFWAQISGGQFTNVRKWTTKQSGLVTNEEPGYYGGYLVLPQTISDKTEVVNINTPGSPIQYFTNSDGANNVGSPEISANWVYVPDAQGNVNAFPVSSLGNPSAATDNLAFAMGFSSSNLTNADEQMLPAANGQTLPTLAYETSAGLQIWQNTPPASVTLSGSDVATGAPAQSGVIQAAVGDQIQLDARGTNLPIGDSVVVTQTPTTSPGTLTSQGQSGQNQVTSPSMSSFNPSYEFMPTAQSSTAQQVNYVATIVNAKGQTVGSLSQALTVIWAAPATLSLTVTPTTSQTTGKTFALTAGTTNAAGDFVAFTQSGSLTNNGGSGTLSGNFQSNVSSVSYPAQTSSSYQYSPTATSSQAGSETVTAELFDAQGNPVTNANGQPVEASVNVTWTAPVTATQSITLAVTPTTSQTVGSSFTLTATAHNITSGEVIQIAEASAPTPGTLGGGTYVQWISPGNYASYAFRTKATSSVAQTVSYQASIYPVSGPLINSNTVSATWTAQQTAPTLTLTASNTAPTAGQTVQLTATGANLPSGATIYIHDLSGANTLSGTNVQSGTSNPFTALATSGIAQTVQYHAAIFYQGGYIDSGTVSVTWGSSSSPPPTAGTLTLSAQANAEPNTQDSDHLIATGTGLTTNVQIVITQDNTTGGNTFNFQGQTNSSGQYYVIGSGSTLGPIQINDVSNASPYTATYSAQAINPTTGQVEATAQTVNVTWQNQVYTKPISITVTMTPSSQQVGAFVTGAVVAKNVPYGYPVTVWAQPPLSSGGYQPWWETNPNYQLNPIPVFSGTQRGVTGNFSATFSTTEQLASTTPYLYQGMVQNPNSSNAPPANVVAYAAPVYVTWTAPAPIVSLSPNAQTLVVGQVGNYSLNLQNIPPGDTVEVQNAAGQLVAESDPVGFSYPDYVTSDGTLQLFGINSSPLYTTGPVGLSVPASVIPGFAQLTATVVNSAGTVATSNTITITWVAPTISLSASLTALSAGQTSTLTATGLGVPAGDYVEIWATAANGNPTAAYATIGTVAATGTYNQTGSTETFSLTQPNSTALPFAVKATSNTPQQVSYTAAIVKPDQFLYFGTNNGGYTDSIYGPKTIATSNSVTVTWGAPTVILTATPTLLEQGQSSTLTATASVLPPGDQVVIRDVGQDNTLSGANTASSNNASFQTNAVSNSIVTDSYVATIVNSTGQAVATSSAVSVTWASQCPAPPGLTVQNNQGQGATIAVSDPSGDTLNLSATGGTLSQTTVTGTTTVQLAAASGATGATVTATDATNSGCPTASTSVTWTAWPQPGTPMTFQITDMLGDPGTPSDLWTPTNKTASQSNHNGSTDGSTVGGGPPLPTYGNPSAHPAVYVRPDAGFGFRALWTGPQDQAPTKATATYTMTNPDGNWRTWTVTGSVATATVQVGANGSLSEYTFFWTPLPKYTTRKQINDWWNLELAAWSLTGNPHATISVTVTFYNGVVSPSGAVTWTWTDPDMAQTLGYPLWYFIHQVPNQPIQPGAKIYHLTTPGGTATGNILPPQGMPTGGGPLYTPGNTGNVANPYPAP